MTRVKSSLPAGQARCHECRSAAQVRDCQCCGASFRARRQATKYCSVPCRNQASNQQRAVQAALRSGAAPSLKRTTRRQRESAALGVNSTRRRQLLAEWKRQGRACTYCPSVADTLDHVVPLIRGGSNWEGNLAPCCRRCNGSKAGLLVSEWRTGRRCTALPYVA